MFRLFVIVCFVLPLAMWNGFGAGFEYPKWMMGFLFASVYLISGKPQLFILRHLKRQQILNNPFIPLCLLCLLHLLLTVTAINPWKALTVTGCLFVALVFYIAGAIELRDFIQYRNWIAGLCLSGCFVSIYGMSQINGFDPLGFGYYDPISTFGHRNFAAQFLIIIIPLAIWLTFFGQERRWQIIGGITAPLAMIHLAATTCRGAWLGFAGSMILSIFLLIPMRSYISKRTVMMIVLIVTLLFTGLLTTPTLRQRAVSIGDIFQGSNFFRILVWRSSLEMIIQHPLTGIGPGQFGIWYPSYRLPAERLLSGTDVFVQRAHNDYLHTIAETGMAGFIIFILLGITLVHSFYQAHSRARDEHSSFLLAATAAITATAIHGFFSMNWRNPVPLLIGFALLGACCHREILEIPENKTKTIMFKPIYLLVSLFLLAGIGANGFNQYYAGKAQRQEMTNQPFEAAENYLKAARFWPGSSDELYHAGYNLIMSHQPEKAIMHLKQALLLSPWFTNAMFNLAVAEEQIGNTTKAVEIYEQVLNIDSLHEDSRLNLGYIQIQTKQLSSAESTFQTLLKQNPHCSDCWNNLGITLVQSGKLHEANQAFQSGLKTRQQIYFDPSTVRHFSLFGAIDIRYAIELNNDKQLPFEEWATVSFSPRPGTPPIIHSTHSKMEIDYDEQTQGLTITFQSIPNIKSYLLQYRIRNNLEETRINVVDKIDADLWSNLGYCFELQGNLTKARTCYVTAITIDPTHRNAQKHLQRLDLPGT